MGPGLPGLLLRHVRCLVEPRRADPLTDRALIQRFAAGGDETAFATLVSRHGPMVLRVCQHVLGNLHDAEDAFQATFLVLARKASALPWQDSLAGWLHETASRLALKAKTAACRRRTHETLAGCDAANGRPQPAGATPAPAGEISVCEAQAVLNEELNRLADKLRTPLVLCYLEGMTQDQAARQAGWSLSTLKRRLRRGLELLRGRLRRRGLALAAVLSATHRSDAGRVSAALQDAVTRAGVLFRAGLAGRGASRATSLAEAFLKQAAVARLRTGAALLLFASLAVGGGLCASRALTPCPAPAPQPSAEPTPAASAGAAPALADPPPRRDRQGNQPAHAGRSLPSGVARPGSGPLRFDGPVQGVAFSPDGTLVAGCGGSPDGTLRLWNVKTAKELWRYELGCGARAVAYSPGGRVVAVAGDDRTVRLCDADSGQELRRLRGHAGSITALAFTPDRKSLISASLDGTVRLWDPDTGAESRRFTTPGCALHCLALSRDGKLLAAGAEELPGGARLRRPGEAALGVFLWELPSGKERPRLSYYPGGVQALAFAPDGRTLAAAGQSMMVMLWDLADVKRSLGEIHPFTVSGGRDAAPVKALAFGAGSRTLAWGFETGVIHECDLASRTLRRRLVAFQPALDRTVQGIFSLTFAPDGQTLAAGGSDRLIHLWDTSSGKQR